MGMDGDVEDVVYVELNENKMCDGYRRVATVGSTST